MSNEFISSATATIKEVASTMQERGSQYCDSWGKDGIWLLTKSLIKKYTDVEIDDEAAKAIGLAVFVDQKYSRFLGGYKKDTAVDIIPYLAALVNKVD
jgi:hypothetical protein